MFTLGQGVLNLEEGHLQCNEGAFGVPQVQQLGLLSKLLLCTNQG